MTGTSTLISIGETGAQYFWDITFGTFVEANLALALAGVGIIMFAVTLVLWGISYLFPRRLRR